MIFRNLDETGDWLFGKGKSNYLTKVPAIAANIRTRIYSWVGDCFFAQTDGIDWYNRLGSKSQRELLELDLRRIILQSYGVIGITEFSSQVVGRKFTASYKVDTIFSQSFQDQIGISV